MIQLDKERASKAPMSEEQMIKKRQGEGYLQRAQFLLDEQLDDVKKMNQMAFYSKVVTVRDKQIQENKRLEHEWHEEQKKLDLMIEIERLKGIKAEEERENARAVARKRGQQVIIDQIAERSIYR